MQRRPAHPDFVQHIALRNRQREPNPQTDAAELHARLEQGDVDRGGAGPDDGVDGLVVLFIQEKEFFLRRAERLFEVLLGRVSTG